MVQQDVDDNNDEKVVLPSKYSTFRKVIEVMTELLRIRVNQSVLDAVGVFLLDGSIAGLNKKNFELISGVLHFVCTKLVKHENGEWEDLKPMLESLRQMYPQMERTVEELRNGHEKELLERARTLVEPVWRCYIDEATKEPMETGFSDS